MTSFTPYCQYFSKFDKLSIKPTELKDFANGTLFHQLINMIESMPTIDINKQPESFTQIFANWKNIYRCIEQFWRDIIEEELLCEEVDFVELAHNYKEEEMIKLGQLFIKSAVRAPNKEYFIEQILATSSTTQQYFMNIVKTIFNENKGDSPRKEKEKKLYDKLIQLMHQNDKLLQFISIIDNEKTQVEKKNQMLLKNLETKERQMKQMIDTMNQLTCTPKKIKNTQSLDHHEKDLELVDKLKSKMIEMAKNHEKQLARKRQELQFFTSKLERISDLQTKIQNNQEKLADAERALVKVNELQLTIRNNMVQLQSKNSQILVLKDKLEKNKQTIMELEQKQVEHILEIQRKNVQIQQNALKIGKDLNTSETLSFAPISMQKTLSEQCPQILNSQNDNLFETTRMLRFQLERNMKVLKERQAELQKCKAQLDNLTDLQIQNKKMQAVIKDFTTNRGQQNDLLVGCIYQLRMQMGLKSAKQGIKPMANRKKILGDIMMN